MEKSMATKNVGYQTFGDGKLYGDKKKVVIEILVAQKLVVIENSKMWWLKAISITIGCMAIETE